MLADSNSKTNFPHNLSLTDRQIPKVCKAFINNSSANIKLSKTQLSKIVQSVGIPENNLGLLIKTGLSFLKVVLQTAKSVLIPLKLNAAENNIVIMEQHCNKSW